MAWAHLRCAGAMTGYKYIQMFTVCKLLGHKDIQTTQIYADVIMPTRIEAVNRLSDFFRQD